MRGRLLGAAAALAFTALWLALHPPLAVPVNADLYTHLSVARHLADGDGFLCDVAYPLSASFAWGRALPQPLLTRQPGFATLLTVPYLAAGRDRAATTAAVRVAQAVLLGLVAGLGIAGLARRRAAAAAPAWSLLLLASPLLGLAVSWGWSEVVAGALLLASWLRWRGRGLPARRRAALLDGLLAGAVAMVRLDLVWVPLWWWLALGVGPGARRRPGLARATAWLALGWLLVAAPWLIRTARVAGSPFFSLQGQAIEMDLGERGWTFATLRGLEPVTLAEALRDDPGAAFVKLRHGARVFAETLGQWLPWALWLAAAALFAATVRRRRRRGRRWLAAAGAPLLLAITLALLAAQYALFSHEVRHLLVLLPPLSWELAVQAHAQLRRPRRPLARAAALAAAVAAALLLTPPSIGGERANVAAAAADHARAVAAAATAADLPPGPVFTDAAAVLWLSGRPGMWSPRDAATEARLRELVPQLRDAPWLRLASP